MTPQTKVCSRCREKKSTDLFSRCSARKDGLSSWCRNCHRDNDKTRYSENPEYFATKNKAWTDANRQQRTESSAAWRKANPKQTMILRARKRAKLQGLDCTLSAGDFEVPDLCPVLGIPLRYNWGVRGQTGNSPSLDRIDNSKGYISGNVQVISAQANKMKNNADVATLQSFARWVKDVHGL